MNTYPTVTQTLEIELTPSEVASWFFRCDSTEQAAFFGWVAKEFEAIQLGDRDGMQFLFIRDALGQRGKAFLKKLYEYAVADDDRCHCAEDQGGPCSFCMEEKHGL